MERPNHLHTEKPSASSRIGGLVIVAGIHVVAILGLIAALAQGQILKQMQDIKASVERDKTPPKAPPPPPPDLVKPPPPVAIVPEFSVQTAAPPPPITTAPKAPPAPPPRAAAPPPTSLEPIRSTFTTPPYPTISQRLGEQGTTTLKVTIGGDGKVTEATVEKTSGSERLDQAAAEWVKNHYRYKPPTREGQPVAGVVTLLNIVWNLKDAQ